MLNSFFYYFVWWWCGRNNISLLYTWKYFTCWCPRKHYNLELVTLFLYTWKYIWLQCKLTLNFSLKHNKSSVEKSNCCWWSLLRDSQLLQISNHLCKEVKRDSSFGGKLCLAGQQGLFRGWLVVWLVQRLWEFSVLSVPVCCYL